MKKDELILNTEEVELFLHCVAFMSDVALRDITQVDHFTETDIKGFTVMCKFLFPLVRSIHEEKF